MVPAYLSAVGLQFSSMPCNFGQICTTKCLNRFKGWSIRMLVTILQYEISKNSRRLRLDSIHATSSSVMLTSTKERLLRFRNPLKLEGRCRDRLMSSRHCKCEPLLGMKSYEIKLYASSLTIRFFRYANSLKNAILGWSDKLRTTNFFAFDTIAKLTHLSIWSACLLSNINLISIRSTLVPLCWRRTVSTFVTNSWSLSHR